MERLMLKPTWLSNLLKVKSGRSWPKSLIVHAGLCGANYCSFKPQKTIWLMAFKRSSERNSANTLFVVVCGKDNVNGVSNSNGIHLRPYSTHCCGEGVISF